jgi:hypothetical protein
MRHVGTREVRIALTVAAALCVLSAPALAGDRPWEQERWSSTFDVRGSGPEDFSSSQQWRPSMLPTNDRHAVEYPSGLSLNLESNLSLSIQSPLVGEWAPSLAFEFRF